MAGEIAIRSAGPSGLEAGRGLWANHLGEVSTTLQAQRWWRDLDRYEGCTETIAPVVRSPRGMHPAHRLAKRVIQAWIFLCQQPLDGLPNRVEEDFLIRNEFGHCYVLGTQFTPNPEQSPDRFREEHHG